MQRTPKNGRKLKLSSNNDVKINQKHNRDVSSTPNPSHGLDSPPCFGETSPCHDAWEPSPIRFMSTQDGSHGENDVIWNYYSPKSDKEPQSLNTPVRRKRAKRHVNEFSPITRLSSKRKLIKPQMAKTNYLQGLKEELLAINKDIQVKMSTKKYDIVKCTSSVGTDSDDMFDEPSIESGLLNECSPCQKSQDVLKKTLPNNICDKIRKCENEGIIESDDSMNECLLMASQLAEEVIKTDNIKINQLISFPTNGTTIKIESPKINNDSFDNLISNMNEYDIEMLSQAPAANITPKNKLFTPQRSIVSSIQLVDHLKNSMKNSRNYNRSITHIDKVKDRLFADDVDRCSLESGTSSKENNNECNMNDFSDLTNLLNSSALNESKLKFGRHNSMPESPREPQSKKVKGNSPSGFIRHRTMPTSNQPPLHEPDSEESSPPLRCTQDEIFKKRQAAKEKLLARRNVPLSSVVNVPPSNINNLFHNNIPHQPMHSKAALKPLTDVNNARRDSQVVNRNYSESVIHSKSGQIGNVNSNFKYKVPLGNKLPKEVNLHDEIERKRREALQKLQMKRAQCQFQSKLR